MKIAECLSISKVSSDAIAPVWAVGLSPWQGKRYVGTKKKAIAKFLSECKPEAVFSQGLLGFEILHATDEFALIRYDGRYYARQWHIATDGDHYLKFLGCRCLASECMRV